MTFTKIVRLLPAVAFASGLTLSSPASSATQTSTMTVQLQILSGCAASIRDADAMDFGQVSGTPAQDLHHTTNISVSCSSYTPTPAIPPTVGIDYGQNVTGTSQRNMSNGSGTLIPYLLNKGDYNGPLWGNDTTNLPVPVNNLTDSTPQVFTIYGVVRSTDITGKPVGMYRDTVSIILTY
jgi:spore coat protein U-like protein